MKKEAGYEAPEDSCAVLRTLRQQTAYGGDVERTAQEFYDLMDSLQFMPNSPTLMNAASWVSWPVLFCRWRTAWRAFSMSLKNAAMIHKSGGGTILFFPPAACRSQRELTGGGRVPSAS